MNNNKTLLAILAFALINAAFSAIAHSLGVARPWINFDYALVLILLAFNRSWLGAILTLSFLLIDVLILVNQIFPFPRISDLLYLLKFSISASSFHLLLLVAISLLVLLKLGILIVTGRHTPRTHALVLFNILLVFYAIDANLNDDTASYRRSKGGLVSSQTLNFINMRTDIFLDFYNTDNPTLTARTDSTTPPWFNFQKPIPPRALLVINESWGLPLNPDIQKKLLAPLANVKTDFFEEGTQSSPGVTLKAELRELCKLSTSSYNLADITNGFEECLPNQLRNRGYTTAAMHGASKLMYDRHHWYPRVGFQKTIFFEDKLSRNRCYSFPGACDLDLMEEIPLFFEESNQRFFYWMTLNTHAPYDPRDIRFDVFDCESFQIPADTESCRNLKLQAQFFDGLAKMLQSKSMEGVEVFITGDHVPVILDQNEKKNFFSTKQVPWIHFKIRKTQ